MNDIKLGQLIEGSINELSVRRDAVHVPIIATLAGEPLRPGDKVAIGNITAYKTENDYVGVVDPFLPSDTIIERGKPFWVLITPKTVVNLSHLWTHPSLPDPQYGEPPDDGCTSMGCD